MDQPACHVATTTTAKCEEAQRLADLVLAAKLAACAQIEQIESRYMWEGQLCHETEWRLTLKTTAGCLAQLEALIHQHHPYDTPQWLVWEAAASAGYGQWLSGAVASNH